MRFLRFAHQRGIYEFPLQTNDDNNFPNLVPDVARIYGMDGGLDQYGDRRAPQEIGTLRVGWWVFATVPGEISDDIDAALAMADWGKGRLFMQPENALRGHRWAKARINNIQDSREVSAVPHRQRKLQATFNVNWPAWRGSLSQPFSLDSGIDLDTGWYLDGTHYLDDGLILDDGWNLNAPKAEVNVTSGAAITVRNWGNHDTKPVITLAAESGGWVIGNAVVIGDEVFDAYGSDLQDVTVTQAWNGEVVSSWRYLGALEGQTRESVVIDCEALTVTAQTATGNQSGYSQFVPLTGFGFNTVRPGDNTFQVAGNFGERGVKVRIEFEDAWY